MFYSTCKVVSIVLAAILLAEKCQSAEEFGSNVKYEDPELASYLLERFSLWNELFNEHDMDGILDEFIGSEFYYIVPGSPTITDKKSLVQWYEMIWKEKQAETMLVSDHAFFGRKGDNYVESITHLSGMSPEGKTLETDRQVVVWKKKRRSDGYKVHTLMLNSRRPTYLGYENRPRT